MKIHNFGAGPCILPQEVFKNASKGVLNLGNTGLSVLEISHRSNTFQSIFDQTKKLVLELMELSDVTYEVLFLQGGASSQFALVPMNFLKQKALYIDTGVWSEKAIVEARNFGQVEVLKNSSSEGYLKLPDLSIIRSGDYDYIHYTSNNTIYGTQFEDVLKTDCPLVCDMSSDIFSKQIDFNLFDLIYAGAQKNIGPAGMTLVVIRKTFLDELVESRIIPTMFNYQKHIEKSGLLNTPPVFSIYVAMLNLTWLKEQGGLLHFDSYNKKKSFLVYKELERNTLFTPKIHIGSRSNMNITFDLVNQDLSSDFLEFSLSRGIHGIKGHRSLGGFRASLYNALSLDSVECLVENLNVFERKYHD
tara:strand:+ start:15866 stop:16945 length:1080 start_codon:yes stop_codon:yes gene_type:complete